MSNFQVEERAKLRKHRVDQAISLAMQSKWEEAVNVNQSILDAFVNDVDAYNRLGRALTELGRYADARQAYSQAVRLDPLNTIAQKNLSRLNTLSTEPTDRPAREKVDPRFFIAETGKTGVANLVRLASKAIVAKLVVGDQVYLQPEGRALFVRNAKGETLGQVEPRLSQRLIELMKGGNRYAAAVMSLDDSVLRVIIRETYQDPSQAGKVSFLSKGEGQGVRPYTKGSLLHYDAEEDDDENGEDRDFESDLDADDSDDAGEPTDFEEEQS